MKLYRKNKHGSISPIIKIGALTIIYRAPGESRVVLAALHWSWSLTWRWCLSLDAGNPERRCYLMRHNRGGQAWLNLWGQKCLRFSWQENMRDDQ